jgi:glycosyltransferase involved in cell wall biosynthesis
MTVLPYFCELDPANAPRAIPDPPTITYLGRVAPNKGHEYFVEALGHLSDEVRGVMVGGIPDEAARTLRDQAERAGCADRLELLGWASRDEVLELFDRTSVFVFPSLWPETLGIVGIEALSRGVPVVASDVGGVREWLEDGENGFVVSPKDAQAIAASLQRLLENEERLLAFGRRGINTVRERFLPTSHVDQLISLYESAIASHSVTSTVHAE